MLQDTNTERKVTLSSLDDWPEGDASDIPLIVDHNGDVILSLKGARDAASKKVTGGSSGGGAKRRNASDSLIDGGVTKKIRELSSDLRKGTKRAKGKRKSTPLSSAYINSESDNAVESDPSGPSEVHLGNELQPQPKPRPHFSNSQASPSVSGVTSAPPPPLIDLPRTDWRGVDLLVHVAGTKFRDWGPIGAQLGLADMGYLANWAPCREGLPRLPVHNANESIRHLNESIHHQNESTHHPNEPISHWNEPVHHRNEPIYPNSHHPNESVHPPTGSDHHPNESIRYPTGSGHHPNETVRYPNGSGHSNESVQYPNGSGHSNESIWYPNGSGHSNESVQYPNGSGHST
ncbi:hypothetical protein BS47DRAFT_1368714 [Hydnum rufescens UP504]|uniref:Uncharacterized protein n=1 Tax=Hydnum rufescens UP504 TaxID=1448309 RepID=A0A9P6DMY0_9AGAM|nr:hypothetical protein BS47DRAFT_1368714 [Hydnum rufescens UP504]